MLILAGYMCIVLGICTGDWHDGVDDGYYVGHVCVVHDGAVHVDTVHDVVHVGGSSGSKSRKNTVFLF